MLDANWRCREGELDLIVRRGSTVVFCEVKTRSETSFGIPAEAVNRAKQARIRRLSARWLSANRDRLGRRSWDLRFDVASVMGSEVDVLEAAF